MAGEASIGELSCRRALKEIPMDNVISMKPEPEAVNDRDTSLEIPAAAGKTIVSMRLYSSPPYGRELLLTFSDGTELVIEINVETKAVVKHYRPTPGEPELLNEWADPDR